MDPAARDDGGVQVASEGQVLEIACDESGSDGENLIGGNTDVFAHASVHLTVREAAACVEEIRNLVRSPAQEYKAGHLLREKHRSVLEWLLNRGSPIYGNAHVHLTDKAFYVVGRVVELLIGDPHIAVVLYREGEGTLGREPWHIFLEACNKLMWTKNRWEAESPVGSFFQVLDVLLLSTAETDVGRILEDMGGARPKAEAFWREIVAGPKTIPALDPLLPAIARTLAYWTGSGRPVSIVHDEQNALTEERIAWLKESFGDRLVGVRFVDSRSDPRVQLADFLAGVARKIASDDLNGRGDARLTALLKPYVDRSSTWSRQSSLYEAIDSRES